MNLSFATYRIKCTHPFGISRSSHNHYDIVYVYLEKDGIIGRGEAAPSGRYGEFTDDILTALNTNFSLPDGIDDPIIFFEKVLPLCKGIKSLEAAMSMASLDWWCQKNELPLCRYLDATDKPMPKTSFTVSIGEMNLLQQKVEEAEPYDILKVKLGTGLEADKKTIIAIRKLTDKVIRVDANEGWDLDTGIKMCKWLKDQNIEFVEQPFKASNLKDTAKLKEKSPLPLIADENSISSADIPLIDTIFDGINIKLMKCGSLHEGLKMIQMARKKGMSIMLGCMIESSVGITAAAHLSPLVDYADLDGNLLINNDPYSGAKIRDGRLVLPDGSGIGLSLNKKNGRLK